MEMIFRDLGTAISDLTLELFLTGLLVLVLFLAGWWLRRWSLEKRLRARALHHNDSREKSIESANFWQGISTELFGAVITTVCFGIVLLIFQQFQAIQNRKADLVLQMGSPDHSFAVEAVRQMAERGWLGDGTLRDRIFHNLDLADTSLYAADFWHAFFYDSDLSGVNLEEANLQRVGFSNTNLSGANLRAANLIGADFSGAVLSAETILPDSNVTLEEGEFYFDKYYDPELGPEQMWRYTNPRDPDFWDPCEVVFNDGSRYWYCG